MKKSVLVPLVTALIVFVIAYLFLCCGPGMGIKLAADPWTYFVENLTHMAGSKLLMSAAAAGIAGAIGYFAHGSREK